MASFDLPTVKVVHADGYAIINESDYDPDTYELYEEPEETAEPDGTSPFETMTKDDLHKHLTAQGVQHNKNFSAKKLRKIAEEHAENSAGD